MDDDLGFILRSQTRIDILLLLSEEPGLDRTSLVGQLETSRRTVNRVLAELAECGYLFQSGERFQLTAYGDVLAGVVDQWSHRREFLHDYRAFLSQISPDELGFDPLLLGQGELTTSTETEPYAALDRLLTLRREATEIKLITPLIERTGLDQIRERLYEGDDLSLEAIIPESMYERLMNGSRYSDSFVDVVETASITVFVYPESLPAFFGLFDDVVTVAVTDNGLPTAMAESTSDELIQHFNMQFERYCAESTPITSLRDFKL